MTLTGAPFLLLMAAATIAAFVAVVLAWSRFRGRGVRPLAGRLAALAAVQLLLLGTVSAAANSYFGFYESWHDLVAVAAPKTAAVTSPEALGAGLITAGVTVHGETGLTLPDGNDPARAGELLDTTIQGQLSGLSEHALIFLPPQYFQPDYQRIRFPAVLVSSGYPGDATKLATMLHYPARLVTGVAAGQDKPVVLIMMSPMIQPGRDTECTDVPGGPLAETFWAQDVPAAVERAYRVTPDAAGWGAIGDSTGGYCALKLAMMNSDRFSAAVSLSGYYDALQDGTTGSLYGNDQAFRDLNNLQWRLDHLPSPPINALLTTSRVGEDNYVPTLAFKAAAHYPMHVSTLIRAQGGHNFDTWNAEIPAALQWLTNLLSPSMG